jgi:hypothetical protein
MSPHWNGYYAGNMMRSVYVLILASVWCGSSLIKLKTEQQDHGVVMRIYWNIQWHSDKTAVFC